MQAKYETDTILQVELLGYERRSFSNILSYNCQQNSIYRLALMTQVEARIYVCTYISKYVIYSFRKIEENINNPEMVIQLNFAKQNATVFWNNTNICRSVAEQQQTQIFELNKVFFIVIQWYFGTIITCLIETITTSVAKLFPP